MESASELDLGTIYRNAQQHLRKGEGTAEDFQLRISFLQRAAEQGHPRAMTEFGLALIRGSYFLKPDSSRGENLVLEAAQRDDTLAVAYCYIMGLGSFRADLPRAFELLQTLSGDAEALFLFGRLFVLDVGGLSQDLVRAVRCLEFAAEQGHSGAYCNLGCLYERGKGVVQDYQAALRCYQRAVDRGDSDALYNLGCMYVNGLGTLQDFDRAAQLFQQASDRKNCPGSQFNLGLIYTRGAQSEDDLVLAREWFQKGAAQGDAGCQYQLGCMYRDGRGGERDMERAVELLRLAADQNHVSALFDLGYMFELSEEVERDFAFAAHCYKRAADMGDADSQCRLGYLYEGGDGVEQDEEEAERLYKLAADQNHSEGQFFLACVYEDIDGNLARALPLLKAAARQDHVNALTSLALAYHSGTHIGKNENEGLKYLRWQHSLGERSTVASHVLTFMCASVPMN